jgi:protease-4
MGLGGALNAGVSYRHFGSGPGVYDNRHFWTLGLMGQRHGHFALAAVFSNLNRGRVNSERTAIEQRYSVAYRPVGRKLTLAADMFLSTENSLSEADFTYHVEYTPTPGLFLDAYVDSDRNFQVGFRANLLKYFVGAKSSFDRNGHNGRTTAYAGATNQRQPSLIPERPRRLTMAVSGRPAENPPQPVFGVRETPFVTLLATLYRAAEDPGIRELVIDLNDLSIGFGQAQELRRALADFKAAGKRIVCHISSPSNISYYVASAADSILIVPVSQLRLVGLRAELTFWAGTFDKLGVKLELLRVGKHKTSPETYTHKAASEENRRQVNRLLDDLYDQFVSDIAEGRRLLRDSVAKIIDNGPFTSAEALQFGLVDGLSYRDQVSRQFLSPMPEVSFTRYIEDTLLNDGWRAEPALAIVVVDGGIVPDGRRDHPLERSRGVKPSLLARALSRAAADRGVDGIVLRVDSPGGYALAGDEIWHHVVLAAGKKPVVVSMANVAASGGYYITTPASRIFANPATITGSIGIYGGKADLSGFYDKIELGKELFTRGRFAGMLSYTRPFSEMEREKYYSHLRAFYDHFVDLVAASRLLSVDSVDQLGRGRVWTGREAVASGLVDELGGVKRALDYMAAENGLEKYRVKLYPKRRPWFLLPGRSLLRSIASLFLGTGEVSDDLPIPLSLPEEGALFTRMPFDLAIE